MQKADFQKLKWEIPEGHKKKMADPKTKSHKDKTTTNNEKVFYKEKCERLKLEK